MVHYNLNTGMVFQPTPVEDHVLQVCEKLLETGAHPVPGFPGYSVTSCAVAGGVVCAIWHHDPQLASGKRPCYVFAAATNEQIAGTVWPEFLAFYEICSAMIKDLNPDIFVSPQCLKRPESTPWCCGIVLVAKPGELAWMSDLERCMAQSLVHTIQETC